MEECLISPLRAAIWDDPRSLYRLCEESGISYSTLYRFAHGERSMTLDSAEKLFPVLGLRVVGGDRCK